MWIVFVGACTLAVWRIPYLPIGRLSAEEFRWVFTAIYVMGLLLLYWSVMRLKRVEIGQEYIYITNYFKHVRYPLRDIEKVIHKERLMFPTGKIYLKASGSFGRIIRYVPERKRLTEFLDDHPYVVLTLEK
jgi:hypothetical protein